MYQVKPLGLNTKDNDRNVTDGFLQESLNLQWRDGSLRPIPKRLNTEISNASSQSEIIMHKVSDEDKTNVLMINSSGNIAWTGVIEDGVYDEFESPIAIADFPQILYMDALSFTISNGIIYFMNYNQPFYLRLQFNERDEVYEVKDMYAWKDLIPYYPRVSYSGSFPKGTDSSFTLTECGVVLFRFTLVLSTGEEVLHSPIYSTSMVAVNRKASGIEIDDDLTNIHALINTNLEFLDQAVFDDNISAINVYSSIPYYKTKAEEASSGYSSVYNIEKEKKTEVQKRAESPFFLVKTIDRNSLTSDENVIMILVGTIDSDIDYSAYDISVVDASTIAAGEVMPVDNFSYHSIYGTITSNNGRLLIDKPRTFLSNGHIRALALTKDFSVYSYKISTEDGDIDRKYEATDGSNEGAMLYVDSSNRLTAGGIISYPDSRAFETGGSNELGENVYSKKIRANKAHNLACAFDFSTVFSGMGISGGLPEDPDVGFTIGTRDTFGYENPIESPPTPAFGGQASYRSENRIQFSESGEFSVWPAINSYRVGEGMIMFVGNNSVDPGNVDYVAPLLIGSSDGLYTVNFDVTGNTLIQSITKAANIPAISEERLQIDQHLIYVSDKGLEVVNNGQLSNLTIDYFPDNNDAAYTTNAIYPNYNALKGVQYPSVGDVVDFMKGALFAFDARRNNLWCSNSSKNFSLVFNLENRLWNVSSYVFNKVVDYYGIMDTSEGDVYSRFFTRSKSGSLDILSGEDPNTPIDVHLLTRPIKMLSPDEYKKINRFICRCELYRDSAEDGFSFGLWGKQDLNKGKVNIPLVAIKDSSPAAFPNDIRQDIPIGEQKGKYKTITAMLAGKFMPESSIEYFEISATKVNNNKMR